MRDDGHGSGLVLLSFLVGGIVGAGVAMLLAPQSGRETREKIKDFADDMREKVTSTVERGRDLYEDRKTAIATAVEAGKEAYEKEKQRLSKG